MGLTIGTLFLNLKADETGIHGRSAVLAFVVALLVYNSMDSLPLFMQVIPVQELNLYDMRQIIDYNKSVV